jgi:hypothetical protein
MVFDEPCGEESKHSMQANFSLLLEKYNTDKNGLQSRNEGSSPLESEGQASTN